MEVETFFRDPIVCYVLDGVLVLYCIVATVLFFRERFSLPPPVPVGEPQEENGRIYQELERPRDADQYQVLEPSKKKKKTPKKKKPKPNTDEERNGDPNEPPAPRGSSSPQPPQ
ncbi:T-cell surface glycoprotein CD3 zeta chain-like isoform X1 [Xyrichtys novacula]|uniref:T-cell surface glycoprotein CD3 zeta chain-like isoform X1 n=1 Tax=Xyrichtys novacula TaxID=13765 RepID=A0AAV1H1G6_XYRNO|nr:T-cell surface glycoprotein CD3 zeta chain-like isoform X1 [Xyrichtys novacula]